MGGAEFVEFEFFDTMALFWGKVQLGDQPNEESEQLEQFQPIDLVRLISINF